MGEKGQAALQNMDFISSIGDFVQGAGNTAQYAIQSGINALATNPDPAQQAADQAAIQAAYANQNTAGSQGSVSMQPGTPVNEAPQAGEKGNMQARTGPIATTGMQGNLTGMAGQTSSPAASSVIGSTAPLGSNPPNPPGPGQSA